MGDGAVQIIRVRARDLLALKLKRVERNEQLRNRKQWTRARFSPRIIRAVDGAQVARCGWEATRQYRDADRKTWKGHAGFVVVNRRFSASGNERIQPFPGSH